MESLINGWHKEVRGNQCAEIKQKLASHIRVTYQIKWIVEFSKQEYNEKSIANEWSQKNY